MELTESAPPRQLGPAFVPIVEANFGPRLREGLAQDGTAGGFHSWRLNVGLSPALELLEGQPSCSELLVPGFSGQNPRL